MDRFSNPTTGSAAKAPACCLGKINPKPVSAANVWSQEDRASGPKAIVPMNKRHHLKLSQKIIPLGADNNCHGNPTVTCADGYREDIQVGEMVYGPPGHTVKAAKDDEFVYVSIRYCYPRSGRPG